MKKFQKVALITAFATLTATQVFAEEAAKEVLKNDTVAVEEKAKEEVKETKEAAKDEVKEVKEEAKKDVEEAKEEVKEVKEEAKKDVKEAKEEAKEVKEEAKKDEKAIVLEINGAKVEQTEEYASFIKENRTFVPLRLISEKLGFTVEWNEETKDITITNKDEKVVFNTQKDTYIGKDGKEVKMDVKPVVKNNRTFLPIRFVSEALGIEINWDGETRTVTVGKAETKTEEKVEDKKEEKVEEKAEVKEDNKEDKKVEEKTETKEVK